MRILGLTGSIAMGKSTVAGMIADMGVPVFSADRAVHDILTNDVAAVRAVAEAFPAARKNGGIDRQELGNLVFDRPRDLKILEAIIHPRVARRRRAFLRRQATQRKPLVVLDVPLLFETGGDKRCDAVAVVTAPTRIQRQRLMARPGMTREKMAAILANQMPDAEKRRRGDFLIQTDMPKGETRRQARRIVRVMTERPSRVWPQPALGPPVKS